MADVTYKEVGLARLERDFYREEKGRWAINYADAVIDFGASDSVAEFYLGKYKECAVEVEAAELRYDTLSERFHAQAQASRVRIMQYADEEN